MKEKDVIVTVVYTPQGREMLRTHILNRPEPSRWDRFVNWLKKVRLL